MPWGDFKIQGKTWLTDDPRDTLENSIKLFKKHIEKVHKGKLKKRYTAKDGSRCIECWGLAARVVGAYNRENSIGIEEAVRTNTWTKATKLIT